MAAGDVPGEPDALALADGLGLGEPLALADALGLGEALALALALGLAEAPGLLDAVADGDEVEPLDVLPPVEVPPVFVAPPNPLPAVPLALPVPTALPPCAPPPTDPPAAICCWTACASCGDAVFAVQFAWPPPETPSTATETPHTFAATSIGTCAFTGMFARST